MPPSQTCASSMCIVRVTHTPSQLAPLHTSSATPELSGTRGFLSTTQKLVPGELRYSERDGEQREGCAVQKRVSYSCGVVGVRQEGVEPAAMV